MVELDKECQKKAVKLETNHRRLFRTINILPVVLVFILLLIYNLTRLFLNQSFYNIQNPEQFYSYGYIIFASIYFYVAWLVAYYKSYKYQRQIELTINSFFSWCLNRSKGSLMGVGSFKRLADLYPLDENKYAELSSLLREQAKKDGISNIELVVYQGSKSSKAPNAAIVGLSKKCSVVLWDNLLSGNFSEAEIASLVAHEQGHFIHKHNDQLSVLKKFIASGTVILFVFAFIGFSLLDLSKQNIILMALPASFFIAYLFIQFGLLLQRAISRQMEYLADAHAVNITSERINIINSFIKEVNLSYVEFTPSLFHEFFYDEHPSTRKRLDLIAGSDINKTW